MNDDEAHEFEREPHFRLAVRVRHYDDMGKVRHMITPELESFVPLLQSFVRTTLHEP